MVKGWLKPLIKQRSILNEHIDQCSVHTWSKSWSILDWHRDVDWVLMECQWRCWKVSIFYWSSVNHIYSSSVNHGYWSTLTTMRVLIHTWLWMSLERMIQMLHISDHIYGPLVFGQKVHMVITPNIYNGYLLVWF